MTGERFNVVYHIRGDESDALEKAKIICFEQTVELLEELVVDDMIRDQIVGQIDQFFQVREGIELLRNKVATTLLETPE